MVYVDCMKTTIDISDNLLLKVKDLAKQEKTTIRELTEEGLDLVLEKHSRRETKAVEPVVVGGEGLSAEFRGKSWSAIREEIYRGYGG